MAAQCSKCKDTGTARWGGFYERRGPSQYCTCPAADRLRASQVPLTIEQIEAKMAARTAELRAARAARRTARA